MRVTPGRLVGSSGRRQSRTHSDLRSAGYTGGSARTSKQAARTPQPESHHPPSSLSSTIRRFFASHPHRASSARRARTLCKPLDGLDRRAHFWSFIPGSSPVLSCLPDPPCLPWFPCVFPPRVTPGATSLTVVIWSVPPPCGSLDPSPDHRGNYNLLLVHLSHRETQASDFSLTVAQTLACSNSDLPSTPPPPPLTPLYS